MNTETTQPPTLLDEWWAPDVIFNGECKPRRVLAQGNGHVLFADGGRKVKEVTQQQFENWVKKYGCTRDAYRKRGA